MLEGIVRRVVVRLTSVVLLLAVSLGTAAAQSSEKVPRVGYISPGSPSDPLRQRRLEAFREGLRELGYVEGQNIVLEVRWAEGQYARYPALVGELVRLKASVIVTVGGAGAKAAKQGTSTIPIVMANVIDPVETGLVPSLARPGGNLTGISIMSPDLIGKQFELLRGAVPKASRMTLLWNPGNPTHALAIRDVKVAAQSLRVQLQLLEARGPQEIDRAFVAMTRAQTDAVLIVPDTMFTSHLRQIAEIALQRRLPSIYGITEYAHAGGLMVYSTNLVDLERRAATFVDKILKGAKPGDLPIEQPSRFELIINIKTAKALGLTVPPSLLLRADQVLE